MLTFLEDMAATLTNSGIRTMVARPSQMARRLQAPLTSISISKLEQLPHDFAPEEGRLIQMTVSCAVASPTALGGVACVSEALELLAVFMGDFSPWTVGVCAMGECAYCPSDDHFATVVTAELSAIVNLEHTADAALVGDFILEGEIL